MFEELREHQINEGKKALDPPPEEASLQAQLLPLSFPLEFSNAFFTVCHSFPACFLFTVSFLLEILQFHEARDLFHLALCYIPLGEGTEWISDCVEKRPSLWKSILSGVELQQQRTRDGGPV